MRRLWYHGKVDTMVPGEHRQQAVGVENGTIVFVGSDRDALALPWDEKRDLEGRQVLPGFSDTHMHLLLYALFRDSLPLAGVPSIEEMIRQGRDKLTQTGAPYLLGMGWNQETLAEKRMPSRADLDQISREIPVCLLRTCAHVAACNTPMLERLKALPDLDPGVLAQVDFEAGLLREEAMRLYMQVVPPLSDGQVKDLIRKGQADANAKGLTCVHSDDLQVLPGMDPVRLVRLFREMEGDGELTLRVYEQCLLSPEDFARFLPLRSDPEDRTSLFRTGPRKLLQDGSLGARTALLRDGYQDDPDWKGVAVHSPRELEELIGAAHRARMDVAVHTIGDGALEQLCQAVEDLQAQDPWPQARHGAVHAQITDPALLERMKALGLQAYIQPIFIEEDMGIITQRVGETLKVRDSLLPQVENPAALPEAARWDGSGDWAAKAKTVGVLSTENEDIRSLRELITYGLKGLSAYSKHANALLQDDGEVDAFLQRALAATLDDSLTADELVALTMETGKYGVQGMALLDKANTQAYGNPQITKVSIGVGKNPGILVSGHDLRDLEMLLEQTQGTGVDVYTHSEMLPAHYYPAFKKYPNFVGNYGNAWWKQKEEFESFNGPILMTTNCIVPPKDSYKDRLYTTGAAGYPGCKHIPGGIGEAKDFSALIAQAKTCPPPREIETGEIVGGFAHAQVLALADKIVEAVKSGAIKKFVVMAGCDGRAKSRNYYTEFAKALPKDAVILTAGCAKYKYNKLDLGDIGGIPRVLDAGQCNDSYSLAVIALKLKEVFGLEDVNDLPIIYNIAWYEQKAVIVLLALLYLGVKNIHLGPTLPAFLSPNVAKVLVDNFGIAGIGTVEDDIQLFFGEKAK